MIYFILCQMDLISKHLSLINYCVVNIITICIRILEPLVHIQIGSALTKDNKDNKMSKLEALAEHRPPWPRQIITPIFPTVKMLSLGGERPPPLPPAPKKKRSFGSLPAPPSGYATTIMVFFAHFLILEYPDYHQNLIISLLYYPGPLDKMSSQSVHNLLSNVVLRQTNRQTDKPRLPKT